MREPAVTDSTCLIGLDRVGRLDLLPKLFDPIAAPPEVEREWGLSCDQFRWYAIDLQGSIQPVTLPGRDPQSLTFING